MLSMPMCFREHFRHCVVIIDCLEIECERFEDLLDRNGCYSHYRGRPTYKGMLGISPQETISHISQGHGGRATDVAITLDSKYVAVGEEPFLSFF